MSKEAIDELMEVIEIAEDKNKIALIDLVRLLLMHEHSSAHIVNRHWSKIEISIFEYIKCLDLKDTENKVFHNYHLICLKMLGNIYQTGQGRDYL
jgi:predicted nucleic acid-binding protein